MECQYCLKILKTKWSLKNHQKTTKYCLKIQGENECKKIKCNICQKTFTTKTNLGKHIVNCKKSKIYIKLLENKNIKLLEENKNIKKELNQKYKLLEKELNQKYKLLEESKLQINKLIDKLENVAVKAATKPTINNNNRSIHINNIINNLQPIRDDELKTCGEQLTLEHHRQGAEGYAKFALDIPFKDKLACVDINRKKFKYKDNDGNIIEDEGFHKMFKKFCQSVSGKSLDLSQEHYDLLAEQFGEKGVDDNLDCSEFARALGSYSGTNENAFCKKIINIISKNTKV